MWRAPVRNRHPVFCLRELKSSRTQAARWLDRTNHAHRFRCLPLREPLPTEVVRKLRMQISLFTTSVRSSLAFKRNARLKKGPQTNDCAQFHDCGKRHDSSRLRRRRSNREHLLR